MMRWDTTSIYQLKATTKTLHTLTSSQVSTRNYRIKLDDHVQLFHHQHNHSSLKFIIRRYHTHQCHYRLLLICAALHRTITSLSSSSQLNYPVYLLITSWVYHHITTNDIQHYTLRNYFYHPNYRLYIMILIWCMRLTRKIVHPNYFNIISSQPCNISNRYWYMHHY